MNRFKIQVSVVKLAGIQADLSPMLLAYLSFVDESWAASALRVKWKHGFPLDSHPHMLELFPSKVQVEE